MNEDRKLLTVAEYASKVGKDRTTINGKIKRGTLPAVKIGERFFVYEDTPYTDSRVKTGEYSGLYDKYGKKYYNQSKEDEKKENESPED